MRSVKPHTPQHTSAMASSSRTPYHLDKASDSIEEIRNCQKCKFKECVDCIGAAKRQGSYDQNKVYGQEKTIRKRGENKNVECLPSSSQRS